MRWLHRLYARAFGYFWLPCSVCGEHFGGHQWKQYATIPTGTSTGRAVCSYRCAARWHQEHQAGVGVNGWKDC